MDDLGVPLFLETPKSATLKNAIFSFFLEMPKELEAHLINASTKKNGGGRPRGFYWLRLRWKPVGWLVAWGVGLVLKTAHHQSSPTIFFRKGPSSLHNKKTY